MAAKPEKGEVNPRDIAAHFFEKANGDVVKATDAMTNAVLADIKLYRTIMDPLVREACYNYMTMICRQERKAIWTPKQPSTKDEAGNVVRLSYGISSSYLMFRLPGGKYLKDAVKGEVDDGAEFYLQQGNDMVIKGRWLKCIALSMPNKKRVEDVFEEEDLVSLRAEVERGNK